MLVRYARWLCFGLVAMSAAGLFVGCDDDDGGSSDDSGSVNSVVGTWAVNEGSTPGNPTTWWVFYEDGRFTYFNDAGLTSVHLTGTYTQDGNTFGGPFVNPGVGDGEIQGTLSEDGQTFQMNFIEFWHSPPKVVPQTGVRL